MFDYLQFSKFHTHNGDDTIPKVVFNCVPGSSVRIASELRAGRSGIESRWGRDFPPVQTGPGAHPASCKMGTGSSPKGKVRPGRAADHSPPF